ncbi:unnamed protein product [Trichogramma brassicae]|uniref:Uncharacterized protein n=1 Tax=Trichogramma brassicae TaxID=86971 RepID=A0A6H5IXJ8_9HYME|nr:unnamed protein product [Trichogramma brassicae]
MDKYASVQFIARRALHREYEITNHSLGSCHGWHDGCFQQRQKFMFHECARGSSSSSSSSGAGTRAGERAGHTAFFNSSYTHVGPHEKTDKFDALNKFVVNTFVYSQSLPLCTV